MTKKRARWLTVAAFFVLAIVFIVASVSQIIRAVFVASHAHEVATAGDLACGDRLKTLAVALDRASERAGRVPEAHARATFVQALSPEWDDSAAAESACTSARGKDAWSALLRLRRTLEGRSEKDAREVEPVRRDFEARLP